MRLVGAILVAAAILLGLQGFFAYRHRHRPPTTARRVARTSQDFSVKITLTFRAVADAFALSANDQTSLVIESLGQRIHAETGPIEAGTSLSVPLTEQVIGANELFVRATVAADADQRQKAMRVQILRGGSVVVADESIWAEPGDPVQGTVRFGVRGDGLPGERH